MGASQRCSVNRDVEPFRLPVARIDIDRDQHIALDDLACRLFGQVAIGHHRLDPLPIGRLAEHGIGLVVGLADVARVKIHPVLAQHLPRFGVATARGRLVIGLVEKRAVLPRQLEGRARFLGGCEEVSSVARIAVSSRKK